MKHKVLMDTHADIAEVETIAMEAMEKVLRTGLDINMALKTMLHYCVIKPSEEFLMEDERLDLHDFALGWLSAAAEIMATEDQETYLKH